MDFPLCEERKLMFDGDLLITDDLPFRDCFYLYDEMTFCHEDDCTLLGTDSDLGSECEDLQCSDCGHMIVYCNCLYEVVTSNWCSHR